jgi:ribosomal protein S18 acetylase RimI-like enzyme
MFECVELEARDIDAIGSLWNKLREHQQSLSPYFSDHYERRSWKSRKADLVRKSESGGFHADVVIDGKMKRIVGYYVSTISTDKLGRHESIYIEPGFQKSGIGNKLMQRALDWMDKKQVKTKTLTVGVGNEKVLGFCSRYGFYPKHIIVEQVKLPKSGRPPIN